MAPRRARCRTDNRGRGASRPANGPQTSPTAVTSWKASITGPALTEPTAGDDGDNLTLVGAIAGSADVRIIDPATGQLYNGNTLLSVDLAMISFVPARTEWPSTPSIAFANGTLGAVIALSGGGMDLPARLVDDTMAVDAGPIPRSAWDTLDLTALAGPPAPSNR